MGLSFVPYLEGERTPDKPYATGSLHGMTLDTMSPSYLARAAVEGLLCGLADGLDALVAEGARVDRVFLIGGGAKSAAVRAIAPAVLGRPVVVPPVSEYVADGAARQAAWTLSGAACPARVGRHVRRGLRGGRGAGGTGPVRRRSRAHAGPAHAG